LGFEWIRKLNNLSSSLETFKQCLDQQGFISPMLGALKPRKTIRSFSLDQDIFGIVLQGNLEVIMDNDVQIYAKHDMFSIRGSHLFEIHSGDAGAEYLFTFKTNHLHTS